MKVILVGAGKMGLRLARSLVEEGVEVTVIDENPDVIQQVNNSLDVLTVTGNALDFSIFKELKIETYDLMIATVSSDESNVLLASISKRMGCKMSVARVRDPQYHKQIRFIKEELEIDYVINPDHATAMAIEKYLLKRYSLMSDEFAGGKVKLVEFNVSQESDFVGKSLMELKGLDTLLVSAVSRRGETIIPNGRTILEENDVILVIGARKDVDEFDRTHSNVNAVKPVKNVLILGGGKLGHYLGQLLTEDNINVTIIENNLERAKDLKDLVPKAMVIHGDGTNFDTIREETLHNTDAFVAATGIDETNILMALSMKQEGISKSVAKISRPNFNGILDRLHLDAAFNPSFITASVILKLVRGKDALSINLMIDGDAEITEIKLSHGLPILDTPLKELHMPKGILISAIVRDGEVIIPNGNAELKANDRIIVFCHHKNIQSMKSYFYKKPGGFFHELRSRF
ncbi:Trk system potassium transporter TrkA [Peptoniphilus sp. KCTC 25270]|uniref:Trk system potassium transporter TrkA n=1 Tax=Peptoniphilus sp. KCTC 25270 TaxID=2897414 RepID=UPI001E32C58A|nr:Trk system potassium transporter TrkA [Peptoniphilus sp. KCTC 25270]MCD1147970.1 Trk system potassium transporter TrkA [Peptoniphilus sp. KCTC 25270]